MSMEKPMPTTWDQLIQQQAQQSYYQNLQQQVALARTNEQVYPAPDHVLRALKLTPFSQVKVVILGQDPYHGEGQADGLAFSVPAGVKFPPSLRNIFKAIQHDYPNYQPPLAGDLSSWAEQGVLLLNTVLTVSKGQAHSHAKWGWETFTDAMISALNEQRQGLIFMLWGAHAQQKAQHINPAQHLLLKAVHPSPLSAHRGFFTCAHFRQANAYLTQQGKAPIHW